MGKRIAWDVRLGITLALVGLALYLAGNSQRMPRASEESELSVAAPIPLQLLASFGDRYLAANVAVWRTLMVGTGTLPRETLAAQARVQEDASFFNPGHEDNYVVATAILPWEGFIRETQTILRRATEIRKTDVYAPYFYAFNQMHFLNDAKGAYEYGLIAASHAKDQQTREALNVIAAAWSEKGDDPAMSVRIIRSIADDVRDPGLKRHLMQRALRQETILELQRLADKYTQQHREIPSRIGQLVDAGMLARVPDDPVGTVDFIIDSSGKVRFIPRKQ